MDDNAIENALEKVNNLSLTIDENEMEEITRAVMLAPEMSEHEAHDFMNQIRSKGIDSVRSEMGEKQFLIKCFRAAAYFSQFQNIMTNSDAVE